MQWLSLLSNQIKIKTNVGRTGLSERATDPQYPMSPDTAPDINIVNQIGEDEDTWKCLTFVCLKSWENAYSSVKKNFYSQTFVCPKDNETKEPC